MPLHAQLRRSGTGMLQRHETAATRPGPAGLTQLARDLNSGPRNRAPGTLTQRMPVQRVQDDIDAPHMSEAKWEFDRAAQRKPTQLQPLRSALMNGAAQAPMQFAWSDYLKGGSILSSLLVGGATAALAATGVGIPAALALGTLAGASTYAGGVGAGLGTAALGGAGIALGAAPLVAPVLGAVAGGAAGALGGNATRTKGVGVATGVAGAALGAVAPGAALSLMGALYGGTIGMDLQSKAMPMPNMNAGMGRPLPADAVFTRAKQNAARLSAPNPPTAQQIVNALPAAGGMQASAQLALNGTLGAGAAAEELAVQNDVRNTLAPPGAMVMPGAPVAPPGAAVINAVRNALSANAFVNAVTTGGGVAAGGPALAPGPNPLAFANAPSGNAQNAIGTFNRLVDRPAPMRQVNYNSTLSPVSSMSNQGDLNESWAATEGVTVHELGHHLEDNLSPLEFGTVHNFLAARSAAVPARPTGLGAHFNQTQTATGYNTNTPNPDPPSPMPFTSLGTSLIGRGLGLQAGDQGVDHFTQSLSHTPQSGYATQVYDGSMATEFLSTTIHLLTQPQTAHALLQQDPLRFALYLRMARPADFNAVAASPALTGAGINLNQLIHNL